MKSIDNIPVGMPDIYFPQQKYLQTGLDRHRLHKTFIADELDNYADLNGVPMASSVVWFCCQLFCADGSNQSIPEGTKLKQVVVQYSTGAIQQFWFVPPSIAPLGFVPGVKAESCNANPSEDNTAPTLESRTPSHDSANVPTGAVITMNFDEPVQIKSGSIVVFNVSTNSVHKSYDLSTGVDIDVNGSTVKLLAANLDPDTIYSVVIPAGGICDLAGNPLAGIPLYSWQFITAAAADNVAPVLQSQFPAHNETDLTSPIVPRLVFDEEVRLVNTTGGAIIQVRKVSDDSIVKGYDFGTDLYFSPDNKTVELRNLILPPGEPVYIWIAPNSIEDLSGNGWEGIAQNAWVITGEVPFALLSFTPDDETAGVATSPVALSLTYNRNLQVGEVSQKLRIFNYATDALVSEQAVGSIDNDTVSVDSFGLNFGTRYYVLVDAGFVQDTNGNPAPAILDKEAWNFTTAVQGSSVAPANVQVDFDHFKADFIWDAVSNVIGYEIRYRETGRTYWNTESRLASQNFLTLPGLAPFTQYEYQVRSVFSNGPSDWTAEAAFITEENLGSQNVYTGAVFHVANDGDDTADGSEATPWQSIDKVNAELPNLNPGDAILFKRGESFVGEVVFNGVAGTDPENRIRLGAYGDGDNPAIVASDNLTGRAWTDEGGNVYSLNVELADAGALFINGQISYPCNSGPQIIEAASDDFGIVSAYLDTNDFTGGQITFRNKWAAETRPIESHNGNRVGWDPTQKTKAGTREGNTFYIFNRPQFMSMAGDWWYNIYTQTLYYQTAGAAPSGEIYGSQYHFGVDQQGENLEIADLDFRYQHTDSVRQDAHDLYWQHGKVSLVYGAALESTTSNIGTLIHDVEAVDISGTGFYFRKGEEIEMYNCKIDRIGAVLYGRSVGVPGANGSAHNHYNSGISGQTCRAMNIHHCHVSNVSYNGIRTDGKDHFIEYNLVENTLLWLADGGAIYAFDNKGSDPSVPYATENLTIRYNIVKNVIGNLTGYYNPNAKLLASGVYFDLRTKDSLIAHNVIEKASDHGIYLNLQTKNNVVEYNLIRGCKRFQLTFNNNVTKEENQNTGNITRFNTLVCTAPNQKCIYILNARKESQYGLYKPGTFEGNTYIAPYDANGYICEKDDKENGNVDDFFNLTDWVSYSGEIGASFPLTGWAYIDEATADQDLQLLTNYDPGIAEVAFSGPYNDESGNPISSPVAVPAWGGKLLIAQP